MKLIAAAALLTLTATPIYAQTAPATPPVAATTDGAAMHALSVDLPIKDLLANDKSKAVLEANLPGISTRPDLPSFESLTLAQVAPYSGGLVNDEVIAKIAAGLAAIK